MSAAIDISNSSYDLSEPSLELTNAVRALRVLHVVNGEHYAGAERVQDLLALRLPEYGVDVEFACVKPGQFPRARQAQSTPLHLTKMRNRLDLRAAWQLRKPIKRDGIDVVHTHTPRAAMIGRLATLFTHVPLVHHVHGHTAVEVGRSWRLRVSAAVERLCLRGASAVIAVSPSAGEYILKHGVPEKRLWIIPNGVPCRDDLESRPAPRDVWTVGMVAWLRPRKGLETLLEAIASLRRAGRNVRLHVVGRFESPEYLQQTLALATELGISEHIQWVGFTREVDRELSRMDLLVLPSILAEGLPMVVIEALAAGVPVIGSRVPGITDCVEDGREGLLVAPGDSEALAGSLNRFVSGELDWRTFSQNAEERQRCEFSDEVMARQVARLYRHVLAKSRPAKSRRVPSPSTQSSPA